MGSPDRGELDSVLGSSGLKRRWMTFYFRAKRLLFSLREIVFIKSDLSLEA
jgi:hypothetical protein